MKRTRADLAARAKITAQWLSDIANGRGRPSWKLAKKLAALTGSNPHIWMEGKVSEMQSAIAQYLYIQGGARHEINQDTQ